MRLRRLKKYAIGASGMLVLVVAILLATGWSSAVASSINNVFVTNDASHPVAVNVGNTTVPVHEQGTANVNVTNTAVPVHEQGTVQVAAASPINDGAGFFHINAGQTLDLGSSRVATAIVVHFVGTINELSFTTQAGGTTHWAAFFEGPNEGGGSDIQLALTRPITFDHITCFGESGTCAIGMVGAQP